jgi:hypothetical protein
MVQNTFPYVEPKPTKSTTAYGVYEKFRVEQIHYIHSTGLRLLNINSLDELFNEASVNHLVYQAKLPLSTLAAFPNILTQSATPVNQSPLLKKLIFLSVIVI